jgi:hypothetical protein
LLLPPIVTINSVPIFLEKTTPRPSGARHSRPGEHQFQSGFQPDLVTSNKLTYWCHPIKRISVRSKLSVQQFQSHFFNVRFNVKTSDHPYFPLLIQSPSLLSYYQRLPHVATVRPSQISQKIQYNRRHTPFFTVAYAYPDFGLVLVVRDSKATHLPGKKHHHVSD